MFRNLRMTFRHMAASPTLESRARQLAVALRLACPTIERCHVLIEAPAAQAPGGRYHARLDVTVPRRKTAAGCTHVLHHLHPDAYAALHEVFLAARSQLEALAPATAANLRATPSGAGAPRRGSARGPEPGAPAN